MRVLVAGGTGLVGSAIVRSLVSSAAVTEVLVMSRSEARVATLLRNLGPGAVGVTPLLVDSGGFGDAAALRAAIQSVTPILDVAIASLGAGEPDGQRFADLSLAAYDAMMSEMLGAHVAFALATLPLLTADGMYLGIGGGAAYSPMRGGGAISIAAAAQLMMTRVLAAENERPCVRIRELVIDALVVGGETPKRRGTIPSDEVAVVVEELIRTGSTTRDRVETNGAIVRMRPSD